MCDCYSHKCKLCDKQLSVHLGDFETGRDEIEVFCSDHIPNENVAVFTITEVYADEMGCFSDEDEVYIGWKMGIRPLTEKAKYYTIEGYNHPNLASEYTTEFIF